MTESLTARPHFWSSLRWRLSLAISGVALLCTAVCVVVAVIFLSQALKDRATTDLRRTVSGLSGYIDNQHSDLLGAARLIASDPAVQRAVQRNDHQSLVVHLTPFYAGLNVDVMDVVDDRGVVVTRMEDTQTNGDAVYSLPGVLEALTGQENVALERDLPNREAAGGYALRATVPIRDADGRVLGAVVTGRQLDSIFAARIAHALDTNVNLIAGNQLTGTTLTDSHGLPITTGQSEPGSVLTRISSGRASIKEIRENGRTVLSGILPLKDADGHWVGGIEVVRPMDADYDVVRRLSILLLLLGAAVVVIGAVLALNISRRLTSRLSILEATASRVAGMAQADVPLGDMHVAEAVEGNDEAASLARSFNCMMVALDERMAANAELYSAAQARVRELTGLAEIARLLTAGPSSRATAKTLGERVCSLVGASAVAIWLPGDDDRSSFYGGYGLPEDYESVAYAVMNEAEQTGFETTAQEVLRTGEIRHRSLLTDPDAHNPGPAHAALRDALMSRDMTDATTVPLRIQGKIVGAMTCYTVNDRPLGESDLSLLTTIADQVAVAVENARLYESSRNLAALEERQRLARELHDSVSQALFGIALGARTARTVLDSDPAKAAEPLEYVLSLADAGLTEMRALIFELRPEALEVEGLVAVLGKQMDSVRARHGLQVNATIGTEPDVPFAIKEAVYRIAQEALNNAVRHAHARRVDVRLDSNGDGIALEICDDGKGFDPEEGFPGHLGLRTMRERAIRLGGTLDVESGAGHGTRIRAWVPAVTPAPAPQTAA